MLKTFDARPRGNAVRFMSAAAATAFGVLLWSASPASAVVVVRPTLIQTIDKSKFNP